MSEDEVTFIYRNLLGKMRQMPYLQKNHKLENRKTEVLTKIDNGKLISKKMRIKLLNWMEKLTFETFEFSIQTFIQSIQILDQYLSITN